MLQNIIDLLKVYDSYGESEIIDFAKGSKKFPLSLDELRKIKKYIKNGK